jgi:hypothetical protein
VSFLFFFFYADHDLFIMVSGVRPQYGNLTKEIVPDIDITTVENTHVVPNDPELEARERALVRKLDMRIVPMLTFLYICQRLDNSNIGNAKVSGISRVSYKTGTMWLNDILSL